VSAKALAGIRVLEYCQMVAGPYCTKLLADLGAEVIKIEKPGVGDESRKRAPFLNDIPHPERSGLFLYLNTNKLGITLNIENSAGKKVFTELAKESDVLVEDTPPGMMRKLGLDYKVLREINPKLIMSSITPFGQTGPYSDYKAYHLNTFHSGGEGYLTPAWMGTGYLHRPPLNQGKYVGEYESGISAAVATLGALYRQRLSGLGQSIDVSKQQALIALNPRELACYPNDGWLVSRATRTLRFGGIIPCKDGYVELDLYEEHEWQALVTLMGSPEWTKDERFKDRLSRAKHGIELNQLIEEWMKHHTKEEIHHKGQALGCPVAPYSTTKEVVNSGQMKARGFFVDIDHPEAGKFRYPSAPYKFSKTPWRADHPAPLLGQHNEEVYCQRLGYSKQELIQLRNAGII
jgi:CoA:oxalate CoA-transferase